jgi:hypothetical protein
MMCREPESVARRRAWGLRTEMRVGASARLVEEGMASLEMTAPSWLLRVSDISW